MSASAPPPNTVKIGTDVQLELVDHLGNVEKMTVQVVDDKNADFSVGFLGSSTPLARAILGQPSGKTIPYRVGDLRFVRILSIAASSIQPEGNAADKREAAIQKAQADVSRTNAVLFASSFSSKWGGYDPDGIQHWDSSTQEEPSPPDKDKPR